MAGANDINSTTRTTLPAYNWKSVRIVFYHYFTEILLNDVASKSIKYKLWSEISKYDIALNYQQQSRQSSNYYNNKLHPYQIPIQTLSKQGQHLNKGTHIKGGKQILVLICVLIQYAVLNLYTLPL